MEVAEAKPAAAPPKPTVSEAGIVLPPSLAGLSGSVVPIGQFHKFQCIGMGMFASVHVARRVTDGKDAALKLWHRPICTNTTESGRRFQLDGEDVSCFLGEVALLSRIADHDHVVKYIGHGYIPVSEGQTGFVAMELIKGGADFVNTDFPREFARQPVLRRRSKNLFGGPS